MIEHKGRTYLEDGDRFTMHPDSRDPEKVAKVYECLSVTPGSAVIRDGTRKRTDFTAHKGRTEEEDVGFDKPGRRFTICPAPLGISMVPA